MPAAAAANIYASPYDTTQAGEGDVANVALDIEDGRLQQSQQALIVAPHTEYYQSREQAINEVETVIRQLGQMFQQLSSMLAAQAELTERYHMLTTTFGHVQPDVCWRLGLIQTLKPLKSLQTRVCGRSQKRINMLRATEGCTPKFCWLLSYS